MQRSSERHASVASLRRGNGHSHVLVQQPFLKLPIRFCAKTLAEEVRALPPSAWEPHPTGFVGNEAVRLVSAMETNDAFDRPMGPTENLLRCPYIMEVMAELGGTWGRSRLMGLSAGADVPTHVDIHYYWRTHLRIHIPIITNPAVSFTCDDETVHMAAGECWVFDSFRPHGVRNLGDQQRIHLVLDTVGSDHHWDLIEAAQNGVQACQAPFLTPGARRGEPLFFEQVNAPSVMSPWEIRSHFAYLAEQCIPHPRLAFILGRLERFACAWSTLWARFGPDDAGLQGYTQLITDFRSELKRAEGGDILLQNGRTLYFALNQLVLVNALSGRAAQIAGRPGDTARRAAAS